MTEHPLITVQLMMELHNLEINGLEALEDLLFEHLQVAIGPASGFFFFISEVLLRITSHLVVWAVQYSFILFLTHTNFLLFVIQTLYFFWFDKELLVWC